MSDKIENYPTSAESVGKPRIDLALNPGLANNQGIHWYKVEGYEGSTIWRCYQSIPGFNAFAWEPLLDCASREGVFSWIRQLLDGEFTLIKRDQDGRLVTGEDG